MMLEMPILETNRLRIRPFVLDDLADVRQLLDVELRDADLGTEGMKTIEERSRWLQWVSLNGAQLAMLGQPPYGDRAVVLRHGGQLIGSCGFVPCLMPFEQLPYFGGESDAQSSLSTPEFGLYWAISPAQRRRGYATEAAQAMVDYAFQTLKLKRVVATTSYDNVGSMGVMVKLGMRLERNPYPQPPWLQVVGVLENQVGEAGSSPAARSEAAEG